MVWVVGAVALIVTGSWVTRTARAVRRARAVPVPDLESYVVHASAVGTVVRVVGLLVFFGLYMLGPQPTTPEPTALQVLCTVITAPIVITMLIIYDCRWPQPTGSIRTAGLRARSLHDTAPLAESVVAAASLIALGLVTMLTRSQNAGGRALPVYWACGAPGSSSGLSGGRPSVEPWSASTPDQTPLSVDPPPAERSERSRLPTSTAP